MGVRAGFAARLLTAWVELSRCGAACRGGPKTPCRLRYHSNAGSHLQRRLKHRFDSSARQWSACYTPHLVILAFESIDFGKAFLLYS